MQTIWGTALNSLHTVYEWWAMSVHSTYTVLWIIQLSPTRSKILSMTGSLCGSKCISVFVCVCLCVWVCVCRPLLWSGTSGGILTSDTGKGAQRLTGRTVLWRLGPRGPSEKATSSTGWHNFHSYWTSQNIWVTVGSNYLINRVWNKRKKLAALLDAQTTIERHTDVEEKRKQAFPFPVNANFYKGKLYESSTHDMIIDFIIIIHI